MDNLAYCGKCGEKKLYISYEYEVDFGHGRVERRFSSFVLSHPSSMYAMNMDDVMGYLTSGIFVSTNY